MNKNVLSYVRACKACSDRGWYSDLVTITADCGEDQIDVDVVFGYRPFAAEPDVGIMERYPEVYAVYLVDHDVYAETAGRCVEQKDIDAMHEAGDLDWYIEKATIVIKTINDIKGQLRGSNPTKRGVVFYRGPSQIDGAPIIGIVNRISTSSGNAKTGSMVQTFILNERVHPVEALHSGDDRSVCGDCPHRMQSDGSRSCYVEVGKSVTSVWHAYNRGRYLMPEEYDIGLLTPLLAGLSLRCGTYGDPAAIPLQYWGLMVPLAKRVTGYTHQWQHFFAMGYKSFCMASVDNDLEQTAASAAGWRTFRVKAGGAPLLDQEIDCPSVQGVACADCSLCNGIRTTAKSIAIDAHGIGKGAFERRLG